jgi:hypothetical protein
LQLHVLHAATEAEIETAFAGFAQLRAGVIGTAFFSNHSVAKDSALSSADCGSFKGGEFFKEGHTVYEARTWKLERKLALLIGAPEIGRS